MRIDKFLKDSRIIKRRTVAKNICEAQRVKINDNICKAGTEVKVGDTVQIEFSEKPFVFRVLDVTENVSKKEAGKMYELL